jgi:O-antigen/teichoic acid export membrane protein
LIDRLILERMVSMASLGIYGFGYQLGRSWNDVNMAVADAWAPLYYRLSQDGQRGRREIARLQERMLAPLAVVSLGCALAAPDLLRVVTTEKFHAAGTIVSMVIAAYAAHGIYVAFISGLFAEKRTRLLPVFSVLAALINVAFNLALIPRLGIVGAAWATIAGYGFLAVCVVVYAQRVHRLPLRNPAGWFVSVIVYAGAWSMIFVTSAHPWRAVALKATAFVMFVAWLGFARALPSRSDLTAFVKPGAAG